MKYSKIIKLKNGSTLLLRNGTKEDGNQALQNFILTHSQTNFLRTYPEECTITIEEESNYLQEKADSKNEIEIVAEIDGKIIGTAGIESVGQSIKLRHRADFGIGIDKAYWGLGIGFSLTAACIECAKTAGYTQLELNVVGDNAAAINLYKKCGFVEFGRNPKGFRLKNGKYQGLIYMRLEL